MDTDFKSGFVALVGRPNVGKSTLLNACLGQKVAIESPVAQTTRKRLRAVVNTNDAQIVIVDTPGLHKPKDALGKELNRSALGELADVDAVAMLVDATMPVGRGDAWVANHVNACSASFKLLVITKADLSDPQTIASQLESAQKLAEFDDSIVVSAPEGFNVDGFLSMIVDHLPNGPRWFPEDMSHDASLEDIVAEFVREKAFLNLREEIPHSVGVVCNSIEYAKDGHASIEATILVERESQKGIVIGSKGSMIKRIGSQARPDIERLLGCKVYLSLSVRVQPQWRRDRSEIRRMGYDASE